MHRRFIIRTRESKWRDEHLDLYQNIEATISALYRQDTELDDWDVRDALGAMIRKCKAQARGRDFRPPRLTERAHELFIMLDGILNERQQKREELGISPETPETWLRALKEIRTSVKRHQGIHGKRGYLDFIIEFT